MTAQQNTSKWRPDLSMTKNTASASRLPPVGHPSEENVFGKPFDVSDIRLDPNAKNRNRNQGSSLGARPDMNIQHDKFSRAPNSGMTRSIGVGSNFPKDQGIQPMTPSISRNQGPQREIKEDSQVDITDEVSNHDRGSVSDYRPLQNMKMSQSRYTANLSTGLEDSMQ